MPPGASWEELMRDKRRGKKSALKNGGAGALAVSTQRAFEGAHPDGGTMKIFVQVAGCLSVWMVIRQNTYG